MPPHFSNETPIFLQLADNIKSDIINGVYNPNEKLPSVRDFAFKYAINPNTVQKALQLLEEEGLIKTDSTNGKFVADNPVIIQSKKQKIIYDEVESFLKIMSKLLRLIARMR